MFNQSGTKCKYWSKKPTIPTEDDAMNEIVRNVAFKMLSSLDPHHGKWGISPRADSLLVTCTVSQHVRITMKHLRAGPGAVRSRTCTSWVEFNKGTIRICTKIMRERRQLKRSHVHTETAQPQHDAGAKQRRMDTE